jgi:hypothetical protein
MRKPARLGDFRLRRKTAGTHGGFNRDGGRWFFRHMLAINDFAESDATGRTPSHRYEGITFLFSSMGLLNFF